MSRGQRPLVSLQTTSKTIKRSKKLWSAALWRDNKPNNPTQVIKQKGVSAISESALKIDLISPAR
jgi:hypothetical protein